MRKALVAVAVLAVFSVIMMAAPSPASAWGPWVGSQMNQWQETLAAGIASSDGGHASFWTKGGNSQSQYNDWAAQSQREWFHIGGHVYASGPGSFAEVQGQQFQHQEQSQTWWPSFSPW